MKARKENIWPDGKTKSVRESKGSPERKQLRGSKSQYQQWNPNERLFEAKK